MVDDRRVLALGLTGDVQEFLDRVEASSVRGLYLGSETCSRLLPSDDQVRQLQEGSAARGLSFALVTPAMVPETMLSRVVELLDLLPDDTEVIANDWGVLRLVGREHPRLEPVLGRMLCGLRPDPRVPDIARELLGEQGARDLLVDLAWPPPCRSSTAELLRSLRVRRIELNPVAQGLPSQGLGGFAATLHQPWSILAATRFCPQQRITDPDAPLLVRRCARECLERAPLRLDHEQFPQPLYLVGNAVVARVAKPQALPPEIYRLVTWSL